MKRGILDVVLSVIIISLVVSLYVIPLFVIWLCCRLANLVSRVVRRASLAKQFSKE